MTRGLGGAAARGIALPGLVALLAGLALLLALPALLSASMLNAAIQMLIAALFACAFNLLCGQGGMLSFGHSAYFGVGVFATVHAMNALAGQGLLPTPLLPVMGALAGMVFGAIAGWCATQRTGTYFAMITLALAELVHALAPHIKGVFGGESGVSAMRMPAWGFSFGEGRHLYYMTLFWVLLALLLLYGYTRTPLGRLTLGLRENGHRLRFLGYNTHLLAVLVFTVSSMFSGLAGGLQAVNNELGNYVVFDAQLSSSVVLNSYIGGVNMFLGPALGAALMTFFGLAVSDLTRSWLLYQGILFVVVMLFMPTGLAGLAQTWALARRSCGARRLLPLVGAWLVALALLSLGTVFAIELLQQLFSTDYRAGVQAGAPWPAVRQFGRAWAPGAVTTWLVPLVLLAAGTPLARWAGQRWAAALDAGQGQGAPR